MAEAFARTAAEEVAEPSVAGVSWAVWTVCHSVLGTSILAQILAMGAGAAAGTWVYVRAVLLMRVDEAHQVRGLIRERFGRA